MNGDAAAVYLVGIRGRDDEPPGGGVLCTVGEGGIYFIYLHKMKKNVKSQ